MDTSLDKDGFPIWLLVSAGIVFPFLMLAASVVAITVHNRREASLWLLLAWSFLLLLAFLGRYRAGKFASLRWEFHFGMVFIALPVFTVVGFEYYDRCKWIFIPLLGLGFVVNAVRYVKYFYPRSKAQPAV